MLVLSGTYRVFTLSEKPLTGPSCQQQPFQPAKMVQGTHGATCTGPNVADGGSAAAKDATVALPDKLLGCILRLTGADEG